MGHPQSGKSVGLDDAPADGVPCEKLCHELSIGCLAATCGRMCEQLNRKNSELFCHKVDNYCLAGSSGSLRADRPEYQAGIIMVLLMWLDVTHHV
jgi:hypothetical protein